MGLLLGAAALLISLLLTHSPNYSSLLSPLKRSLLIASFIFIPKLSIPLFLLYKLFGFFRSTPSNATQPSTGTICSKCGETVTSSTTCSHCGNSLKL